MHIIQFKTKTKIYDIQNNINSPLTIFNDWFLNYKHINWIKLKEIRLNKKQKYTKSIQFDGKKIRVNKYMPAKL